jgi:hypothetical protein
MRVLNTEFRIDFGYFYEIFAAVGEWFANLGFYGWLFSALLIAGAVTGLVYLVRALMKVDFAKLFESKDLDYIYFIVLAFLFLIYVKYPNLFAPLTGLAVLLAMIYFCLEYGKSGKQMADQNVNKLVLIAAFVVPILPLIWAIVGSEAPYLHLLVMAAYVLLVVLLLVLNPLEFLGKYDQDNNSVYLVGMIGLFAMICVFLNKNVVGEAWPTFTSRVGFLLLCLITVGFTLQYALRFFMQAPSMSPNYLIMLAIIVGFVLLFGSIVFKRLPRPATYSHLNVFVKLLAFWYCRLQDFFISTDRFVPLLLVVEAVLILYYIYSRKLYTALEETPNGTQLVNEPLKLNKAHGLAVKGDFNYNYAVSCWIWLMPQPPEESPTATLFENVLDYSGKPRVLYNAASNTLRISMQRPGKDGAPGPHILMADIPKIPLQKWLHLVLSYNNGTFDIFLNGSLYLSVPAVIPTNTSSEVAVGVSKGNRGKLCNLVFFKGKSDKDKSFTENVDAISAEKVLQLYNEYANKSPPIVTRIFSTGPDPSYADMRV